MFYFGICIMLILHFEDIFSYTRSLKPARETSFVMSINDWKTATWFWFDLLWILFFINSYKMKSSIKLFCFSPPLSQTDFSRAYLTMKLSTPPEWMPKVTSCPTSCLIMLVVCSAGEPLRIQKTWIRSSTSFPLAAMACSWTSAWIQTCWLLASWQRGGMVAWKGPKSTILDTHDAITLVKCWVRPLWREAQP